MSAFHILTQTTYGVLFRACSSKIRMTASPSTTWFYIHLLPSIWIPQSKGRLRAAIFKTPLAINTISPCKNNRKCSLFKKNYAKKKSNWKKKRTICTKKSNFCPKKRTSFSKESGLWTQSWNSRLKSLMRKKIFSTKSWRDMSCPRLQVIYARCSKWQLKGPARGLHVAAVQFDAPSHTTWRTPQSSSTKSHLVRSSQEAAFRLKNTYSWVAVRNMDFIVETLKKKWTQSNLKPLKQSWITWTQ